MIKKNSYLLGILLLFILQTSCEKFFDPQQELVVETDEFFKDWSDYRSAEMGLYAIQQELVDQLVILGELRGDLLEVTNNAEIDLVEVQNFQITRENKYASPVNFYRLIGACNILITKLEKEHPEVLENAEPTDYDRLYGEAKCMRAWAYFNAVRIYGKIPYIWPSLSSIEEITNYVNSGGTYVDSVHITFDAGGYYNDTTLNQSLVLERIFLNQDQIIDTFTGELENDIKAVGVIHNRDNFDATWNVTVWTWYAYKSLLGQLYLYRGDYSRAKIHFDPIMQNTDSETSFIKYGLDGKFSYGNWKNIFSGLDGDEHIYTLWFGKSFQQTHNLQRFFSNELPNEYMIKPTRIAVDYWETIWDGFRYNSGISNPEEMELISRGNPGDFHRGYGISYVYKRGDEILESSDVREMLQLRAENKNVEADIITEGVDTLAYKYLYNKQPYDQDANFIIYRAAAIHLYYAEIYSRWEFDASDQGDGSKITLDRNRALNVLNNGNYFARDNQLGVRGRVGFGGELVGASFTQDDGIKNSSIIYVHDPKTNEVVGYEEYPSLLDKQEYLEDQIINERARELAFEGERFYDLIRIAKRRNDPSYLAEKVSQKFKGSQRELIYNLLLDEKNWYVPFYE